MVTLLKSLAGIYCVAVLLTRQSTDVEVSAAFKKVARKAHPDKGGAPEHQKALNAARDAWQDAVRAGEELRWRPQIE
jgi:curved DNA-binding protein CbpA